MSLDEVRELYEAQMAAIIGPIITAKDASQAAQDYGIPIIALIEDILEELSGEGDFTKEEDEEPKAVVDFDAVFIPDSPKKAGLKRPIKFGFSYQQVAICAFHLQRPQGQTTDHQRQQISENKSRSVINKQRQKENPGPDFRNKKGDAQPQPFGIRPFSGRRFPDHPFVICTSQ